MLQNNAFVEPGAEVETIKGNLLRVVNRPNARLRRKLEKKSSPKPFHWAVRHKTNTVSQAAS